MRKIQACCCSSFPSREDLTSISPTHSDFRSFLVSVTGIHLGMDSDSQGRTHFQFDTTRQSLVTQDKREAEEVKPKPKEAASNSKNKFCAVCEEKAEAKNAYCLDHKRAWDVLYRQAKEQKRDCGPKWIAWVEVFGGSYIDPESGETVEENGNEELQAQVLCDYCRKFPAGRRGQKQRGSLDLTHYSRKRGARAEKNTVSQNPLLDYELFSVKMATKRNWSKQKATGRNKMRV